MPAIRGIYGINPKTKEKGIWIEPSGSDPNTYIGISQTDIDTLTPVVSVDPQNPTLTEVSKINTFGSTLETNLQQIVDSKHPMGAGAIKVSITINPQTLQPEVLINNPNIV